MTPFLHVWMCTRVCLDDEQLTKTCILTDGIVLQEPKLDSEELVRTISKPLNK